MFAANRLLFVSNSILWRIIYRIVSNEIKNISRRRSVSFYSKSYDVIGFNPTELHLYHRSIKCHNTRDDMTELHSMSGHSNDNIQRNVLNVHTDVSIKAKLFTYGTKVSSIKCRFSYLVTYDGSNTYPISTGSIEKRTLVPQKKGQIVRPEISWGRASERNLSKSSDRTESLTKAAT